MWMQTQFSQDLLRKQQSAWWNPQKYSSEAGVLMPPTAAVGSLQIEQLPKANPGPGSRPACLRGKTLHGHLKGKAAHVLAKSLSYFPLSPKPCSSLSPTTQHSRNQCSQSHQTLKVFNDLPASSAGPKQLSIENNILINPVQTGVWNTCCLAPLTQNMNICSSLLYIF